MSKPSEPESIGIDPLMLMFIICWVGLFIWWLTS